MQVAPPRLRFAAASAGALWLLAACATPSMPVPASVDSGLDPVRDVYSFENDLYWEYDTPIASAPPREAASRVTEPNAERFAQRCASMASEVRQFHYGARFDPSLPRVSETELAELVDRVMATSPRRSVPLDDPVVIPGFADLRELSEEYDDILKWKTGARWRSYLQRGNWRMILGFGPGHQRATAESLLASLAAGHPPIVHLVNFPDINVNHTLLLHRADAGVREVRFDAYDPNNLERGSVLVYERETARFVIEPTPYFAGGPVKAYEIYRDPLY